MLSLVLLLVLQWGPASPAEVRAVRQEYDREKKHRAEQASQSVAMLSSVVPRSHSQCAWQSPACRQPAFAYGCVCNGWYQAVHSRTGPTKDQSLPYVWFDPLIRCCHPAVFTAVRPGVQAGGGAGVP
jgi:hypothetical protein